MGRPSNPATKYFQRTLTNPQRMILLAAGKGNLCRGFENVLDLYSEAHNQGFRPGMELSILNIRSGTTNSPDPSQSVKESVRVDRENV
jgi:hypothetical protein